MVKQLLTTIGLAKKPSLFGMSRGAIPFLPGGILPIAAYLAWTNRDKIRSAYNRWTHHEQPASAA